MQEPKCVITPAECSVCLSSKSFSTESWVCSRRVVFWLDRANSNSVFTSRQSPFRARGIARAAFCNSRCSVAEGREAEGILGAGGGWVGGAGAFGCGSGGVGAAQDSLVGEGARPTPD